MTSELLASKREGGGGRRSKRRFALFELGKKVVVVGDEGKFVSR
ncbi:Protein of unknown function [Gryllus bimaculatus]|nr:Protein of unknown function [Gryllus bimaculatus]